MTSSKSKRTIAIIGAGPAGLMAAHRLAGCGLDVTIYEQKPNAGRKFLLAGRSGLNLTNTMAPEGLVQQYGTQAAWLAPALAAFSAQDVVRFAETLGQSCFDGAGGKVFPVELKATPLLRAWLAHLKDRGVKFRFRTCWRGFGDGRSLKFAEDGDEFLINPDAVILALGGRSWPRTGSDGAWVAYFSSEDCAPFVPSNCGFTARLPAAFYTKFAGNIVHDVALRFGAHEVRGDLMVTAEGFEGAPVYALSSVLRQHIAQHGAATVSMRLRSAIPADKKRANRRLVRPRESLANQLRRLGYPVVDRGLILAWLHQSTGKATLDRAVEDLCIDFIAPSAIDRAISTAGGLRRDLFTANLMVRDRPGVFAAGEMLDWEAPTGGFLLQGCFSTGALAADAAARWVTQN